MHALGSDGMRGTTVRDRGEGVPGSQPSPTQSPELESDFCPHTGITLTLLSRELRFAWQLEVLSGGQGGGSWGWGLTGGGGLSSIQLCILGLTEA